MNTPYAKELTLAIELARTGGAMARTFQERGVTPETKAGDEPVTEADRAVNAHIVEALARAFPGDAILAEESPPDPRRFETSRTWLVDPIDGTREFIAGTHAWDVLIGLVEEGEPVLGVAFNQGTDKLYLATRGSGAWAEHRGRRQPLVFRPPSRDALRLAIKQGQAQGIVQEVVRTLPDVELVEMRTLGVRVIDAVTDDVDVVLHAVGSAREWDTCAMQVILEEAGGVMLNCLGERPRYIKEDLVQRHGQLVAHGSVAREIAAKVRPIYGGERGADAAQRT